MPVDTLNGAALGSKPRSSRICNAETPASPRPKHLHTQNINGMRNDQHSQFPNLYVLYDYSRCTCVCVCILYCIYYIYIYTYGQTLRRYFGNFFFSKRPARDVLSISLSQQMPRHVLQVDRDVLSVCFLQGWKHFGGWDTREHMF